MNPDKPRHDIYVRVEDAVGVGLVRSVEVAEGVVLDWQRTEHGEGSERLIGVEVLNARSVEVDGIKLTHDAVFTMPEDFLDETDADHFAAKYTEHTRDPEEAD